MVKWLFVTFGDITTHKVIPVPLNPIHAFTNYGCNLNVFYYVA